MMTTRVRLAIWKWRARRKFTAEEWAAVGQIEMRSDARESELSIERRKLREQLAINIKLVEDLRDARADGWDQGWAALVDEYLLQRQDPCHPIGRANPYRAV